MSDGALQLIGLIAAVTGMGCFALSVTAHWRQLMRDRAQSKGARIALRSAGVVLLAVALWLCALADPPSMAVLVWTMLLTIAAGVVAAAMTLQARLAR